MAGTKAGGIKARESNMKKYGPDFYKNIGAKGGANGTTGGFYANRKLASIAGAMGGYKSRRASPNQDLIKKMAIGSSVEFPMPAGVNPRHFPNRYYTAASKIGAKITISSRMGNVIITRLG